MNGEILLVSVLAKEKKIGPFLQSEPDLWLELKNMQADEDVGKIAMAVPLLVSKTLELFLQDLCDRTYEITLKREAKTVNSLHLKQCVQSFNSFDFLKDTMRKVPDLGGSDGAIEDKSATKRRKISEDEDGNDEEPKRICMQETGHVNSSGRGRGRPRGRGRGRGSRTLGRDMIAQYKKSQDAANGSHQNVEDQKENFVRPNYVAGAADSGTTSGNDDDRSIRNFDLNVELNVNGDSTFPAASAPLESCEWGLNFSSSQLPTRSVKIFLVGP